MTQTTTDPFRGSTGGGRFPKIEELEDRLVLIRPIVVEKVANKYKDGALTERMTADVIVFDENGGEHETYESMYISQEALVGDGQKTLRRNNPNQPFILGRLGMLPNKGAKEKGITDRAALKKALAEWVQRGGKGDKPGFFWGLDAFTDADANLARPVALALINQDNPFA